MVDKGYKEVAIAALLLVALVYSFATGLSDHLFPEVLSLQQPPPGPAPPPVPVVAPAKLTLLNYGVDSTIPLRGAIIADNSSVPVGVTKVPVPLPTEEAPYKPSKVTRFVQLILYLAAYGFVLFSASNMLSEGAELLLLIPSLSGLVGSVVLPVLGAVPDGAIVLFSMLGPREQAAASISVGVGALAGSTIMLLTVPWGLCVLAGRVSIDRGVPNYAAKPHHRLRPEDRWAVIGSGVQPTTALRGQAIVMLLTTVSYVVLMVPMAIHKHTSKGEHDTSVRSSADDEETLYAVIATGTAIAGLLLYLVYCIRQADSDAVEERVKSVTLKSLNNAFVSLSSLFDNEGLFV